MKKTKTILLVALMAVFTACAELAQILQSTIGTNVPLTTEEIIEGLKEALSVGTDSTVSKVSKLNGYYLDELIKILLPPEAKTITDNLAKLPGGQKLVEDVIVRINRAAEEAAREAAPIFLGSIKSMTFNDALGILKGTDNAATEYLRSTTSGQLFSLYKPKIQTALDKKLIANISAAESWTKLTTEWNKVARSLAGRIAGLKAVNVQLDDYLTQKGLDGLFLKIADVEKKSAPIPQPGLQQSLKGFSEPRFNRVHCWTTLKKEQPPVLR